ncbi:MAG: trypsin-like peptidase domain-containing protein, partial [Ignavibacteria bacterium]
MKLLFLTLVCLLTYFNINPQIKEESPPAPIEAEKKDDDLNAEQIIELNKPALISIWYHTDNYYSYYSYTNVDTTLLNGSGFIITEDGLIGTNFHVVDGIDSLLVKTSDGTFYDAELMILDEKNDMAIIKIKYTNGKAFPTVKLGNSDAVKVGQEVFAIGSPLGYEYTISQGIVAGIRDDEKVSFTDPVTYMPIEKKFEKVIQITAAISPGNSGGALFNTKGEVIGITTFTYTGYGNLNFAVAINSFSAFKNSVDLANIENNEAARKKREESLFFANMKLASSYKSQVSYNWYYSKQKDTMKIVDTFLVKQDSINKVNFFKAENLYNKCILLQPDSFIVYQELMDLYVYTENFEKAEQHYKNIREKFQNDSLLNLLSSSLASAYSTSKDYKKALLFYDKMLKLDTNDVYIYFQVASIYEKMDNNKKAIREYEKLIKKDPNYTQAYIQLGAIYYEKLKDYEKAKKYLTLANEKELLSYGSSSYYVDIHYYLGMIAVKEDRKLDAIFSYMELKNIYTYIHEDN